MEQQKCVEYYNIKITKRKQKDNILEMADATSFIPRTVVLENQMTSPDRHSGEAEPQVISGAEAHSTPTPHDLIKEQDVKRCLIQLFKNDDRYKLKVRLNARINGEDQDIDFIAPLTLDRRNFLKYMPEECGDWFRDWSDLQFRSIKNQYGVKAYRGKFHMAQAYKSGRKVITQIEPWCQCLAWYDLHNKQWMAMINIYDFSVVRELNDHNITPAQRQGNIHRHDIWLNPLHDRRTRPQTWAQRQVKK
jgi:hypothetical protein